MISFIVEKSSIRRGMEDVRKIQLSSIMFWAMLLFYVGLLIQLLFMRGDADFRSVNFIPFASINDYIQVDDGIQTRLVDVNVWGNILIFIPAGIYFMLLRKTRSTLGVFLTIIVMSVAVEIIQYTFAIGATDIDDVILNSFGGLLGIILFYLIMLFVKSTEKAKKIVAITSTAIGIPLFILVIILFAFNR
ncbi:VanZ family protein [Virgibacillus salexigens]|nr:VanZ family protein [Virgibacillus salexigens]MYL41207.1 hypothetical protein [Virgibacillus massiliensis]